MRYLLTTESEREYRGLPRKVRERVPSFPSEEAIRMTQACHLHGKCFFLKKKGSELSSLAQFPDYESRTRSDRGDDVEEGEITRIGR